MKKLLLMAISAIFYFGVKQDSQQPKAVGITGSWELRATYGGITGIPKKHPAGNGNILQFNTDSTFKIYRQTMVVNQGTFSIVKNGIVIGTSKFDGIYYNHNKKGEVIKVKKDTLTIGVNYADGITALYVRK